MVSVKIEKAGPTRKQKLEASTAPTIEVTVTPATHSMSAMESMMESTMKQTSVQTQTPMQSQPQPQPQTPALTRRFYREKRRLDDDTSNDEYLDTLERKTNPLKRHFKRHFQSKNSPRSRTSPLSQSSVWVVVLSLWMLILAAVLKSGSATNSGSAVEGVERDESVHVNVDVQALVEQTELANQIALLRLCLDYSDFESDGGRASWMGDGEGAERMKTLLQKLPCESLIASFDPQPLLSSLQSSESRLASASS